MTATMKQLLELTEQWEDDEALEITLNLKKDEEYLVKGEQDDGAHIGWGN